MNLAPIIIFAFNRIDVLQTLIKTLKTNPEAKLSDVYIFVDGARTHVKNEKEKINKVQEYVMSLTGFQSLHYTFSDKNQQLAPSIITGVTEVLRKHDRCIVLEDDLILSNNFLAWMNQCLYKYEEYKDIFQISGFTPSVVREGETNGDVFFTQKAHSWGWAIWRDRWCLVDWELKDWDKFSHSKKAQRDFAKIGNEMPGLLFDYKAGRKSTWWARFCYSQFKLSKLTIYPIRSKVINEGFTNEATHCNVYNRYRVDFDQTGQREFLLPDKVILNDLLLKRFYAYYSFRSRIIGKLKTFLLQLGLLKQYIINIEIIIIGILLM